MMKYIIVTITLLTVKVFAHVDDIYTIKYTTANFNDELAKNNNFVMFYAPWCGHCQRLAPTWEQLAEMLNEDNSNIRIAKVDCTTDNLICSEQDITGYPTLKFFKVGSESGVKFRGTRDLPTLTTFINEQLREGDEKQEIQPTEDVAKLIDFSTANFHEHTAVGKHFIKFYAPWCGHCQKLAPVWDQLAQTDLFLNLVTIGKIDCTQHNAICNSFEVRGYPTLLWIENGKKIDKYQGDRTLASLTAYVKKMMGSDHPNKEDELHVGPQETTHMLNADNFQATIEKGITFVKFFAPWCGHCKRLAPIWEDLGRKFADDKIVNIVKFDCTLDNSKDVCNKQQVEGYPTMYLYKNGEKISEYTGNRNLDDLYEFVIQHRGHDEL